MKSEEMPSRETEAAPLRARTTMLGSELQRRRRQRGWSQGQLASVMGVDRSIISRIESGETRVPHDDTVQALARALQVPAAALKELAYRPAAPPSPELVRLLEEAQRTKG